MHRLLPVVLATALVAHAMPASADPLSMFEGESQGTGTLKIGFGRATPYTVDNRGHRDADGTLHVAQRVHMQGEPDRSREWLVRPVGDGRYTFTLSDATGPGVATVEGERLSVRYAPRHGLRMHQVLDLSPDGTTLSNHGRITFLGISVGHLDETIARVSGTATP